jgi:hypothetical protein
VDARRRTGTSDFQRQGGRPVDTLPREIVGGREAPAAIGQHPDSNALRFTARNVAHLAVLDGEIAVA